MQGMCMSHLPHPITAYSFLLPSSSPFFLLQGIFQGFFSKSKWKKNNNNKKNIKSMVHFHDMKIHRNRKIKCQFPSQIRSQLEK